MSLSNQIQQLIVELSGMPFGDAGQIAAEVAKLSNSLAIMRLTGEPGLKEAEQRALAALRLMVVAKSQMLADEHDQRLQGALLALIRTGQALSLGVWV